MIRVEKQDSMSEGSRGLLHLFDWNVKSHQKSLLSTPILSEQSKQKTNGNTNIPITQNHERKNDLFDHKSPRKDDSGKPMGVVARLMGLDSFPVSNFSKTHSAKIREIEQKDSQQIERKQKMIEKFQTEILPPKSAEKSIKKTRTIEVASKIPSSAKKPSPKKPVNSNAARILKGQSMNKSWDGSLERKQSVSLAVQAKVNVKKRESLSLNKSETVNSQPNRPKNTVKKPSTNSVLKQNNQKQNCVTDKGKTAAKTTVANSQKSSNKVPVNVMTKATNRRKSSMEDVKIRVPDKNEKSRKNVIKNVIKCNGSDIVSFTFTSPISHSTDKNSSFLGKNGLNLASENDSLSTLLDKKLRELIAMSSVTTQSKSKSKSKSTDSEPCYVKNILSDIESMFYDFTLHRTKKIVNPRRFDLLEAQKPVLEKTHKSNLRRRLLFDCVSECVDLKCGILVRGLAVVRRQDELVEEVCNDILRLEIMKDCVVEEVVDKSMSGTRQQKWLDFDFEAFEIGEEIQRELLSCLIDEAVDDMFVQ